MSTDRQSASFLHHVRKVYDDTFRQYNDPDDNKYNTMSFLRYHSTVVAVVSHFQQRTHADVKEIRILEIGAFTGIVSITLARLGFRVTSSDIPEYMSPHHMKKYQENGIECVPLNLRHAQLPFDDASFDAVVMCETLEHLNFNPLPVLVEINRGLKKDGLFYLTVPNLVQFKNRLRMLIGRSYRDAIDVYVKQFREQTGMVVAIHWREYTKKEVQEMLRLVGFNLLHHAYRYYSTDTTYTLLLLIYRVFPSLRVHQTIFAVKDHTPELKFHFTDASR